MTHAANQILREAHRQLRTPIAPDLKKDAPIKLAILKALVQSIAADGSSGWRDTAAEILKFVESL